MKINKLLENKFNVEINKIKKIGKGYDSVAFEINDEYIL